MKKNPAVLLMELFVFSYIYFADGSFCHLHVWIYIHILIFVQLQPVRRFHLTRNELSELLLILRWVRFG